MELEKTTFEDLPNEIVLLLSFLLSDTEIVGLCLVKKRYNDAISTAEWLWKERLVRVFGPKHIFVKSWKNSYQNLGVWTFGDNHNGQLGVETKGMCSTKFMRIPKLRAKKVTMDTRYTCFLDLEDRMLGCGSNRVGQLGVCSYIGNMAGDDPEINKVPDFKASSISTHSSCTFVIDCENSLWMCGLNHFGFKDAPKELSIISDIKARNISFLYNHAIMIDMEYNVWVYGLNRFGRLGVGDNCDRCEFVKIPNFKAKIGYADYFWSVFIDLEDRPWICGRISEYYESEVPVLIPDIKVLSACVDGKFILFIDTELNLLQYIGRKGRPPLLLKYFGEKVLAVSSIMENGDRLIIDYDNNVWTRNCNTNLITRIPNILGYMVAASDAHCAIIGIEI